MDSKTSTETTEAGHEEEPVSDLEMEERIKRMKSDPAFQILEQLLKSSQDERIVEAQYSDETVKNRRGTPGIIFIFA